MDANLLLYASVDSMSQHTASREWLNERLDGPQKMGIPWPSLFAFLRIISNPRLFRPPITVAAAWDQAQRWLGQPCVWIPLPTERHGEVLTGLLNANIDSKLVSDIHLAALAIEHGLTVCSTDGDFARFQGVRWENPLTGAHS